ncbi:MAG: hypothetical protein ABI696_02405 [Rubrivivax sp.]
MVPRPTSSLIRCVAFAVAGVVAFAAAGCASRSVNVAPLATDSAEFLGWTCPRIQDEIDVVQVRAVDVAWDVDERVGGNMIALGIGVTVFWPALLAMRSDGPEASELARLKGRFEALQIAARQRRCPPPPDSLSPERAAALPLRAGERLLYEERRGVRDPLGEIALRLVALRRNEFDFVLEAEGRSGTWRQDLAGNIVEAPAGALLWRRLLRPPLALGEVVAGELSISGDPTLRARMRGQVVAVGPQRVAGRVFEGVVIELFGEAPLGELSTRVEGVIVVDRSSGVLLRLDLRSAQPAFRLQRRLVRVETAPA